MLHFREKDSIPSLDVLSSPRIGYQVDAFGCVASENDLAPTLGVDKSRHLFARLFVGVRRLLT